MEKKIGLTPIKRFFNLLKVDRQEIFSIYVYALFNGAVSLSLPLGIQAIINLISTGQVSTSWIVLVIFVIAGVAFTGILQIFQLTVTENLQQKIFARSAFEFAYRIPRMKMESLEKAYIPELVNRFFDTLSVQKGLSKILIDFSSASLQVVFGLILLSFYHPFFILFSVTLVLIVYLIFRFTAPRGLRTSIVESGYKYEVAHWLEELARAMETFKLAGKTPLPLSRTDDVVSGYLTSRKAHFKTLLVQYINLVGFKVIVAAGLLLIGGLLVINQQMNIGQFVASEIIIILVLGSVEKLILSMETIYDVLTSIEKIGNVTDIPLDKTTDNPIEMDTKNGLSVELRKLSYQFEASGEPMLKNISLSLKAGESLCIAGPNGSGKSLLIQIIAGLYERYTGSLSYNNMPMGNWSREQLHTLIGDCLSGEDIFKGSLLENISLHRSEADFQSVKEVVEVLGLNEFVQSLPEGFNSQLTPEGKGLSTSIRLKIMLARSVVSHPRLVLLEDNFDQLNDIDKRRFIDYLLDKSHHRTVIVISNDAHLMKRFDQVMVLDDGKAIAKGSPSEIEKMDGFDEIFEVKK